MIKKILSFCAGIFGLSFVIIIHEFGHFIACKLFGVSTPIFSIGFGPTLIGTYIGSTFFQIAALPLGGYVATNTAQLKAQSYIVKMIILCAGIAANIILAYGILIYFKMRNLDYQAMIRRASQYTSSDVMGPIGIISLISYSATLGFSYYLLTIAFLSLSIGFFNLLPLPFLDGGQMVYYTIETVFGPVPDLITDYASIIFLIFFIFIVFIISFKDLKKLRG